MKTLLGLLILAMPLVSAADFVVPVDSVDSYVNIRQSSEAGTEVVGRLQKGIPLRLVETIPGWHEVELDDEGTTGFVSSDWANVISEEATQLVDEPEPEPVVEEVAEPEPAPEPVVDEVAEAEAAPEPVVEEVAEPEPAPEPGVEEVAEPEPAPEPVVEEVAEPEPAPEPVVEEVAEPEAVVETPSPTELLKIKGTPGFLVKFKGPTVGTGSQIYDDGNQIGIGTTEPKQRLEVNGNIQIHEQNSGVAGLMITQSSGETGYIMHNRASTLTIGAGSIDRITIDRHGNVGLGVARPEHPLELASGAHATSGGVWTNSSSREKKENISELSAEDALIALSGLQPVQFRYKNDEEESYVGFIAEDVPELVATYDRQGLSAMDIVAVLTRVVQAQQQKIEELEAKLEQ